MQITFKPLRGNSKIEDVEPVEEHVDNDLIGCWGAMQDYKDSHKNLVFCAVDKYGLGIGRIGYHDANGRIIPGGMFTVFPEVA